MGGKVLQQITAWVETQSSEDASRGRRSDIFKSSGPLLLHSSQHTHTTQLPASVFSPETVHNIEQKGLSLLEETRERAGEKVKDK